MTFLGKILNISSERALKAAGDLFIYEGDYEAALHKIEEILVFNPKEIRALVLQGDILYCLNRDEEALQALNEALSIDPGNVEALISKAGLLDVVGKAREALFCCQEAFTHITARHAYLLAGLFEQNISLLIDVKRYRQARELLQKAEKQLNAREYKVLSGQYAAALDALHRERNRSLRRARKLSLRIL